MDILEKYLLAVGAAPHRMPVQEEQKAALSVLGMLKVSLRLSFENARLYR